MGGFMDHMDTVLRWPVPGGQGATWEVRPFGQSLADLALDFQRWYRPVLVSAVLQTCLHVVPNTLPSVADPWAWTLNRRLQGLLAVTIATRGAHLDVTVTCAAAACGALMDIPLELHAFRAADDPPEVYCRVDESRELRLRVPTGADQLRWLRELQPAECTLDYAGIARELVTALDEGPPAADWCLPTTWLPAIEAALEDTDPLTSLELNTQCPHCGDAVTIPFDLEAALLHLLAGEQPRVLDEIHCLAVVYHWSEPEIMALPVARRRQYLRRIEEAGRL